MQPVHTTDYQQEKNNSFTAVNQKRSQNWDFWTHDLWHTFGPWRSLYTFSLLDTSSNLTMFPPLYADDTQLYIHIKYTDPGSLKHSQHASQTFSHSTMMKQIILLQSP